MRQNKTSKKQTNLVIKYECPPLVRKLIELLEFLPADFRRDLERNVSVEKDAEILGYFESLNLKIKDYIFDFNMADTSYIDGWTDQDIYADQIWTKCRYAFPRYEDLISAKIIFTQVAERNRAFDEGQKKYGTIGRGIKAYDDQRKTPFGLEEDDNGCLKPIESSLLNNFIKFNVRRDRIRACFICDKIFWADRKDKKTCDSKCLNALRHRNYRKAHSEIINQQRRENYKNRKEGKVK